MSYIKIQYYENGRIKSVEASQFMGNIQLSNIRLKKMDMEPPAISFYKKLHGEKK